MSTCKISSHSSKKGGLMKYHGPGIWFSIHIMSLNSINITTTEVFVYFVRKLIDGFKCNVCRAHAKEYLIKSPPELHLNHPFKWGVDFHNHVNVRNNKPKLTYVQAYKLYKQS